MVMYVHTYKKYNNFIYAMNVKPYVLSHFFSVVAAAAAAIQLL